MVVDAAAYDKWKYITIICVKWPREIFLERQTMLFNSLKLSREVTFWKQPIQILNTTRSSEGLSDAGSCSVRQKAVQPYYHFLLKINSGFLLFFFTVKCRSECRRSSGICLIMITADVFLKLQNSVEKMSCWITTIRASQHRYWCCIL